jgi:predicted HAD superfamily Cof-like phosphohydrolase
MKTITAVKQFHRAAGQPVHRKPTLGDESVNSLRVKLLREETQELEDALAAKDPVAVLDALVDLQYVLDGAYLSLGYAPVKDKAFAEVHSNNMTKRGEDGKFAKREDGKILKPEGWTPPDLGKFVHGDD